MALARTSRGSWSSSEGHGTGGFTTGSFTPSANSLLIVTCFILPNGGSTDVSGSLTISDSAGLTWTAIANVGNATYWSSGQRAWRAPVGASPSSMTVTVDCGANDIYFYLTTAIDFTGYDTSTPIGATATGGSSGSTGLGIDGAVSITLSGAPASDSYVIGLLGQDYGTAGTNNVAPGSGWTELYDFRGSDNYEGVQLQERTGSTSTTVGWGDIDNGTCIVSKTIALAFEVKVAASGIAITPGAGTLTLAGFAPSANRTAHQSVTPGSGAVVLTGAAPSVSVTSASVLTPGSGALTLTGSAPSVALTAHKWLTPDSGAVVLAGSAPSADQTTHRWLTPDAGAVVLTGVAPEVTVTQSGVISPASGALTLTGYAPVQTLTIQAAPAVLVLTGYAPSVSVGNSVAITPDAGAVVLAGSAPGVTKTAHLWLVPDAGAVVLSGAAPSVSVSEHRTIAPDASSLTLTGYAPSLAFTNPVLVPANAEIVITGYAPNVIAIRPNKGAGKSKRRVVIRERVYEVNERDIPALLEAELLDRAPPVTAEVVEGPKPPRKRGKKAPQPVKTVEQVREVVQQIKARIEPDNAWLMQALETVAFRVLERLQDEEDSLMLLLAA